MLLILIHLRTLQPYTTETAGPPQKVLASQMKERKEEILKAVTEAAKKYADRNTGIVKFENEANLLLVKNEQY